MPPQEESKLFAAEELEASSKGADADAEASGDEEDIDAAGNTNPSSSASVSKKKKKKKSKAKKVAPPAGAAETLPKEVVEDILKYNPALASEFQGLEEKQVGELVRKLKLEDLVTGMVSSLILWRGMGGR